jgi:hypothetical protein
MVAYCRGFINQVALEIVNFDFRNREHLFSVTLLPLRFCRQWNGGRIRDFFECTTIGHYC